jgi:hypothetical protein
VKEWQFNVLFFVGVGGAILLVIGPELGLHIGQNPTAVTGLGAILTYVLTQRKSITRTPRRRPDNDEEEGDDAQPRS